MCCGGGGWREGEIKGGEEEGGEGIERKGGGGDGMYSRAKRRVSAHERSRTTRASLASQSNPPIELKPSFASTAAHPRYSCCQTQSRFAGSEKVPQAPRSPGFHPRRRCQHFVAGRALASRFPAPRSPFAASRAQASPRSPSQRAQRAASRLAAHESHPPYSLARTASFQAASSSLGSLSGKSPRCVRPRDEPFEACRFPCRSSRSPLSKS